VLRAKAADLLRGRLPEPVKRWARTALGRGAAVEPRLGRRGVVEDLFFWIGDERHDTVLPLQNYFSVLYPDLDTTTGGTLVLRDALGRVLGRHEFHLRAHGITRLRIREVLAAVGARPPEGYGTLRCHLRIPDAVAATLDPLQPFYFWDRFYIGYVTPPAPPCFVHGVDKTYVADHGAAEPALFYDAGKRYAWAPEIPVDLGAYARFSVAVVNRTAAAAAMTLTVTDANDAARTWSADVAPFGAHRFELDPERVRGLAHEDLRLHLDGIPTRWGRPVVFKEFANGALSAMHC